jgi:hypothetical protein
VGIYRLLVPVTLGGLEQDAVTFVRVIEALAAADGSSGWFAMIAGLGGLLAGLVPAATAKEVWDDPDTIVVGPVTPLGRAVEAAGGFVVSGRWLECLRTANYRVSPLQRQLRDIHAVTRHFSTAPPSQELLGRVLLSPTADAPLL